MTVQAYHSHYVGAMLFVLYSPISFLSQTFLEVDAFCSLAFSSVSNKNKQRDSGAAYSSPHSRQLM
jgi:hypothetical protein